MASQDRGRPLPKFGEWDVNNPATAEGFTVIFNKARDEKKTIAAGDAVSPRGDVNGYKQPEDHHHHAPKRKRKWLCCG